MRGRVCVVLCALAAVAGSAGPASSQAAFVVEGRVVERGGEAGLPGILVTLGDRPAAITDGDGRFRFVQVPAGEHRLLAQGIGYRTAQLTLAVAGDMTVLIELDPAPVPLPPVVAGARRVDIRGQVVERANGVMVIDARVLSSAAPETRTDAGGRFRLRGVPAGVPVTIRAESFGFLPSVVTVEAERDTSLVLELDQDPVVAAMVAEQMARVDARAEGYRYEFRPILDRDDLLVYENRPVHEVVGEYLGAGMVRRIGCVVVDERSTAESFVAAERFRTLRPVEVHRIEVTEYPGMARQLMLRVYTREFVQRLVTGQAELVPRHQAMRRWAGRCR